MVFDVLFLRVCPREQEIQEKWASPRTRFFNFVVLYSKIYRLKNKMFSSKIQHMLFSVRENCFRYISIDLDYSKVHESVGHSFRPKQRHSAWSALISYPLNWFEDSALPIRSPHTILCTCTVVSDVWDIFCAFPEPYDSVYGPSLDPLFSFCRLYFQGK